jgi:hypothetical protein
VKSVIRDAPSFLQEYWPHWSCVQSIPGYDEKDGGFVCPDHVSWTREVLDQCFRKQIQKVMDRNASSGPASQRASVEKINHDITDRRTNSVVKSVDFNSGTL